MSKPKYKTICDNCLKPTTIDFGSWLKLTHLMLDFTRLSKEQKDVILLMIDGALYRQQKEHFPNEPAG